MLQLLSMNFSCLKLSHPLKGLSNSISWEYFIYIYMYMHAVWNASVVLYTCFVFVWLIPHPTVILTNFGSMECNECMYSCTITVIPTLRHNSTHCIAIFVHYCFIEGCCNEFLYSSCNCQHETHSLLLITLIHHMIMLHTTCSSVASSIVCAFENSVQTRWGGGG
jgi:hypothetical protein